jgi:TPR repeat protein
VRRTSAVVDALRLATLSVSGFVAACASDDDTRVALEKAGFTEVAVGPEAGGMRSFTAKKGGRPCTGLARMRPSLGGSQLEHDTACEVPRSCSKETPDVCDDEGRALLIATKHAEARALFEKGCDLGSALACNNLGVMSGRGDGGPRDAVKSAAAFDKACAAKDALGCRNRALQHRLARPPEEREAFARLTDACKLGSDDGCAELGWAQRNGRGVEADARAAAATWEPACARGESPSCAGLGVLLILGEGVTRDAKRGAALLEEACTKDASDACLNLGILLQRGKDLPLDVPRAVTLFENACAAQHAQGCVELAKILESGVGRPKSERGVKDAYRKGCDLGDPTACLGLGLALTKSDADTPDEAEVRAAFQKACDGGIDIACSMAKRL